MYSIRVSLLAKWVDATDDLVVEHLEEGCCLIW